MSSPRSPGKSAKSSASRTSDDTSTFKGETAASASSFAESQTTPIASGNDSTSESFETPPYQTASPQSSFEPGMTESKDSVEATTSVTSDLSQAARTATEAIKKQASELTSNITSELSNTAEQQKRQGAQAIQGFAHAIDTAASELETQSPIVARYVHDAARQIESFGSNLSNRNINELMMAVTDLARRRPALFVGGAVATGIALARFLKSSASHYPTQPTQPTSEM